jgi:hypothetical protein
MDVRLVKERALSNHEVSRGKAVIQTERRMGELLWHFEDENAKDVLSGSDLLRQLWTLSPC